MTGPTRTSQIVGRAVIGTVVLGLALTMCASPRAAELPPERVWVLWNLTANAAWISPKGNPATATNETACLLATVDAARFTPAGTRLACRRTR